MAAAAFLGLMLGVAALVVSVALLAGFQRHIRGRLLAETPHVLVTPAGRDAFGSADRIPERLGAVDGVLSVAPVASGRAWLSFRDQAAPVFVSGRVRTTGLSLEATQARPLGILPGDTVTIVSSRSRLSPLGPVPIVTTMKVESLTPPSTGRRAAEASLPLSEVQRLLALGEDGATGYELQVRDPARASGVARAVAGILGPAAVCTTWEEANRSLVLALRLERIVLFATVFLIVIVAGLNLAATAAVLAATRAGDAAILAVLGASPRRVSSVFLAAGGAVGAAGTLAGALLGAGIAIGLDRTGAIPLPAQLYALQHVPFRVDPLDLLVITALSMAWSFVAAAGPARTAARIDVAETLRG